MIDYATPSQPEIVSGSSFQRGRWWTLVTMAMIAPMGLGLSSKVDPLWLDYGWPFFLGFLAWLGLRGGRLITAGFVLVTVLVLVLFVTKLCMYLIQIFLSVQYWSDTFRNNAEYENPHNVIGAVVGSAFAVFSLWTLLFSRHARLYRCIRRRQIAEQKAKAFEWPSAYRHQE